MKSNQEIKYCECGCGTPVKNRFVNHHAIRVHPISQSESFRQKMCGENNPSKRKDVRDKISKGRKGKCSGEDNHMKRPEYKKMFSEMFTGEGNPMFGVSASEETRKKMSIAQKSRPVDSDETRLKKSLINKGKPKSEDHKRKISETFKRKKISDGSNNPFFNKKHKHETRLTISHHQKKKNGWSESDPRWDDFISPLHSQIRGLTKSTEWRRLIFERDNFTCQKCGDTKGVKHSHHIIKFSKIIKDFDIKTVEQAVDCSDLWDISNGITLCVKCHAIEHKKTGSE